jgi:transcriptional regulator with GAF, ATPase, and Fis domain
MSLKINWKKDIYSVPAIATYLGLVASVISIRNDRFAIAITALFMLSAILLIYLIIFHNKYLLYKRFKNIDKYLHCLNHRHRDYVLSLRLAEDEKEAKEESARTIISTLSIVSDIFSTLTGVDCTASLMLKTKANSSVVLKTVQYCNQVNPERLSKNSSALLEHEGIAGKALQTGDVIVWTKGDNIFKPTRSKHDSFYLSGMSVPFKANGDYAGLLNIDSPNEEIFDRDDHKQLAASLADSLGLITECFHLRKEGF